MECACDRGRSLSMRHGLGAARLYTVDRHSSVPSVHPGMGLRAADVVALVEVLKALTLTTSGQSAARMRRAAIMTPLWNSLKLCWDEPVDD